MTDKNTSQPLEPQVPPAMDSLEAPEGSLPLSSYASIPSNTNYQTSSLEVHAPSPMQVEQVAPHKPVKSFNRRKAVLVSTVITSLVVLLTGASALLLGRNAPKTEPKAASKIPVQEVGIEDPIAASLPAELRGAKESLFVSTDIITRGELKFSNNSFVTVLRPTTFTSNHVFSLPDATGTLCLDSNNCSYAELEQLNALSGQVAGLAQQLGQIIVPTVPPSTLVNNQTGAVTIQGTTNRVTVTTDGGTITLSTPQDLAQTSSPTFSSLLLNSNLTVSGTINTGLNCTTFLNGGSLTTNASGQLICADDETSSGGTSVTTAGGTPGAIPVFVAADEIGDSIMSQALGIVTITGGLTTTGAASANSLTLTTALTVPNGGTGATSFTANGLLIGNGTSSIGSTNAAANAQILLGNGTTPTFTTISGDIAITGAGVTTIQANSVALGVDTTGNYLADISVGNGLSLGGAAGEGVTRSVSLNLQVNKGLEADGNGLSLIDCVTNGHVLKYNTGTSSWGCAADIDTDTDTLTNIGIAGDSGSDSLTDGDTFTVQGGNNIDTTVSGNTVTIDTVNNPSFTTSVTTPLLQSSGALTITPGGALTVGATGQTALLQGSTTTITSNGGGDIILTSADQIRLTGFNCAALANGGKLTTDGSGNLSCANDNGGSGSEITGSGTPDRIALFTGNDTVGDSWLLQNGSTLALDNDINFSINGSGGLVIAGSTITDFVGTGLQLSGGSTGSLQTTLGTSVDLTNEVNGVLPVANGGTGLNGSSAANGQLLIGNGTGYSLATITAGSGITVNNSAGGIEIVNFFGTSIESGEITDLTITNNDIANSTIDLATKTTGNYVATVAGSSQISVSGSGSNNAAVTLGIIADSIGDGQLAFNTGQHLTTSDTPSFTGLNVTGGTFTVGTITQLASLVLHDGDGDTTIINPGNSSGNLVFTLPAADGSNNQCIKTNSSGALFFGDCLASIGGGGGVSGSGSQDRLAKFDASGTAIGDSTITDDGTSVTTTVDLIVQGGGLTLGTALQDAALTLYGNGYAAVIDASLVDAASTFSLPAGAGGEFCIREVGNCSGSGGGNAPNNAQYLTLALDAGLSAERTLSFNGTNFSVIDGGANGSYTVNTAQDIDTSAAPEFGGLELTGGLNMNANNIQGTTAVIDFDNFDVASNGDVTAGTYNGQTISSAANFTGTLTVAGLTTINGGLTVEAGDTITFNGEAFNDLTGNGLQITGNALTLLIQTSKGLEVNGDGLSLIDCTDGQILKYNSSDHWVCDADAGGSGVGDDVSINGVDADGANFVNTAATGTVAGTTFTLNNIANPDEITLTVSVASNTVAGIVTTQAQTFAGLKTFNDGIVIAGDTTLNRPAGTDGQLYYDTDTGTLLVFDAGRNKWLADRGEYIIVAASNSTQAQKDRADYVADGTSDQTEINNALTAGAGGKVLLLPGTYVADGTILIPNNTTLAGSGKNNTTIQLDVGMSTDNLVEFFDVGSGNGVIVEDLTLDGSLGTGGIQHGVYFEDGNASLTRLGIYNWSFGHGLLANNASISTFSNNEFSSVFISGLIGLFANNSGNDLYLDGGSIDVLTGNQLSDVFMYDNADIYTFSANKVSEITMDVSRIYTFTGNKTYDITLTDGAAIHNMTGNNIESTLSITDNNTSMVVSGNTFYLYDDGIVLTNADNIQIVGNNFVPQTGGIFAINITDATSENNYIADNELGGLAVQNNGTGTTFGGQLNASGNYVIQPAGTIELVANTNITGALVATGNGTFQGGTLTVGTTSQAGSLVLHDGNGEIGTLSTANLAANRTYTLPEYLSGTGTICLDSGNCAGSGSGVTQSGTNANGQVAYFTNGNNITSSANFLFDGTDITVGGDIISTNALAITPGGAFTIGATTQTATLQGSITSITSSGTLNVGTNATAQNIAIGNTTGATSLALQAGSGGITLTGNTTNSGTLVVEGASVTVGTAAQAGSLVLSDGSSNTLTINTQALGGNYTVSIPTAINADDEFCLVNLANCSGGAGGQKTYTMVVAADDSPASIKATADFVADGTSDQVEINNALTAAAGGVVYLAEGTYVADGTILVPNNTTLKGAGKNSTIIQLDVGSGTDNLLENSDTITGENVSVQNLALDGSLGIGGTQHGVYFDGVGGNRTHIRDVAVTGWDYGYGLFLASSAITELTSNTFNGSLFLDAAIVDTFVGNTVYGSMSLDGSSVYNFTGNMIGGNVSFDNASFSNTVTGNTFSSLSLANSSGIGGGVTGNQMGTLYVNNSFISNISDNATGDAISLIDTTLPSIISGNEIYNGTTDGLYLENSSNNTIVGNHFTDGGGSGYAINIDANSDNNYIADNTLDGMGINDASTATTYGGQLDDSDNFMIQPAGDINLSADTNITGALIVSGNGTFEGGTLSIGVASTTTGSLYLYNSGSANAGILQVASLGQLTTFVLPDPGGASGEICVVEAGNCGGDGVGATDLQEAYEGGNTILTDDDFGNLDITVAETTNFVVNITGSGSFVVQDNGTPMFTVDQNGLATFSGNVVLGSDSADTITINGYVNSHIIPATNNTYDLGSDTNRWRDLYLRLQV